MTLPSFLPHHPGFYHLDALLGRPGLPHVGASAHRGCARRGSSFAFVVRILVTLFFAHDLLMMRKSMTLRSRIRVRRRQ